MTPNDIEIQIPVAIRLVPAGTAEELGCTTARYDVAVTVNTSEKRIGCLTFAPKPVFGGGTSCFFAELSDEDGNLGCFSNGLAVFAHDLSFCQSLSLSVRVVRLPALYSRAA